MLENFKENMKWAPARIFMITAPFILALLFYLLSQLNKQAVVMSEELASGVVVYEDSNVACYIQKIGRAKNYTYFFVYKINHEEYLTGIIKASQGKN